MVAKGIVIGLAVILLIIVAAVFLRSRGGGTRRLSADEETMPDQYFANGKLRLPVSSHRGGMAGRSVGVVK